MRFTGPLPSASQIYLKCPDKHWFISWWIPFLGIATCFLKHGWSDYCMSMNGWQCLAVLENNFVSCDQYFLSYFFYSWKGLWTTYRLGLSENIEMLKTMSGFPFRASAGKKKKHIEYETTGNIGTIKSTGNYASSIIIPIMLLMDCSGDMKVSVPY